MAGFLGQVSTLHRVVVEMMTSVLFDKCLICENLSLRLRRSSETLNKDRRHFPITSRSTSERQTGCLRRTAVLVPFLVDNPSAIIVKFRRSGGAADRGYADVVAARQFLQRSALRAPSGGLFPLRRCFRGFRRNEEIVSASPRFRRPGKERAVYPSQYAMIASCSARTLG